MVLSKGIGEAALTGVGAVAAGVAASRSSQDVGFRINSMTLIGLP